MGVNKVLQMFYRAFEKVIKLIFFVNERSLRNSSACFCDK